MPFNPAAQNIALDALDESNATGIKYIGIHTLSGGDPGTSTNASGTEATGGSPAYARQAVTWSAAASGQKTNSGALTFDVPAGTYAWFTMFDHVTANTGNYKGHIPFGGASALKGFFSAADTATDTIQSVAHGLSNGDAVLLFNVFAETLPTGTGLTEGAVLYVVSSATNTFKVSTTSGGSAIDITALNGGEGYWQRIVPETFNSQGQITVAAGALVLDATAM